MTTRNGSLAITLSKQDPATNHNLTYRSGMASDVCPSRVSSADRCIYAVDSVMVSVVTRVRGGGVERRDDRNKFCFTGGLIESECVVDSSGTSSDVSLASVILPGSNNVQCVRDAFVVIAC